MVPSRPAKEDIRPLNLSQMEPVPGQQEERNFGVAAMLLRMLQLAQSRPGHTGLLNGDLTGSAGAVRRHAKTRTARLTSVRRKRPPCEN